MERIKAGEDEGKELCLLIILRTVEEIGKLFIHSAIYESIIIMLFSCV
jgi:hypothetical protein